VLAGMRKEYIKGVRLAAHSCFIALRWSG